MVLHLALGAERPDTNRAVPGFLNGAQAWDTPQSNDVPRLGEALFHLQYQGSAAGHQPSVLAVVSQQGKGMVQVVCLVKFKVDHRLPCPSPFELAGLMAATTDSRIL